MRMRTFHRALRLAMDRGAIEELKQAVKFLSWDKLRELTHGLSGEELVCLVDALPPAEKRRFIDRLPSPALAKLRVCAWEFFEISRSLRAPDAAPTIRDFVRPAPTLARHEMRNWRFRLSQCKADCDGGLVYITENNQLLGSLHLLELIDTIPSPKPCPYRLCLGDRTDGVLLFFQRGGWNELPVTDEKGKFLGVVRREVLLRAVILSRLRHVSRRPKLFENLKTSLICRWIPCTTVALLGWHLLKKTSGG